MNEIWEERYNVEWMKIYIQVNEKCVAQHTIDWEENPLDMELRQSPELILDIYLRFSFRVPPLKMGYITGNQCLCRKYPTKRTIDLYIILE